MRHTLKISEETAALAGEMLFGCQNCSTEADTPFEGVFRQLAGQGSDADYVWVVPAHCPICDAAVTPSTLVEPARAVELAS
jgi:hypothetical protein